MTNSTQLSPRAVRPIRPPAWLPGTTVALWLMLAGPATSAGPSALADCTGGPETYVCLTEAGYLAALASLSDATFSEGFEEDAAWGGARTTGTITKPVINTLPSVISNGIVWETNHPITNGISTSGGARRTGNWGVYDPKHGYATGTPAACDIDNPPEHCLYHDGVTGTLLDTEPPLVGAGGFFSGMAGANIAVALDDGVPIGLRKLIGGRHEFVGVISTSGFRKFQFVEVDGKIGQARVIFADDFTFGVARSRDRLGFRRGSKFNLDANANDRWDGVAGGDVAFGFGLSTDRPVIGDWNGDGIDDIGVWRPTDQKFYLDANGNDVWDGPVGGDIITGIFGVATDLPVAGDWNGDGIDDIGFWRPSSRKFYLDTNGNRQWNGTASGDTITGAFGLATDLPVTGDWNGDGIDHVGFWRPSNRRFYLDTSGDYRWGGTVLGDTITATFGLPTDLPITGDWNVDGSDEIGVWRPSSRKFYLDTNGNRQWNGTASGDTVTGPFGRDTDVPLRGRW